MIDNNPLTVEVTRGDLVESRHSVDAVVVDASGGVVHRWGDCDRHVYPRSAIKPLQALPLVETGAAEAFAVSDAEVALACASHNGEPVHTRAVAAWLERLGLGVESLECGRQLPMDEGSAHDLLRAGEPDTALENNCSGKHTGFLATARHLGEPVEGYIEPGHPVQARLVEVLIEMGDVDLTATERGRDGCGIPVIGMPLRAMAKALARMADPSELPPLRAAAAERIVGAMMAHPYQVAGRERFDTYAMQAAPGRFAVKAGAEAVHAAIVPERGLGIALKGADGAKRGSEVAMAAVLDHLGLLDDKARTAMRDHLEAPLFNRPGERTGSIRMAKGSFD